jgi:hypothetical protein
VVCAIINAEQIGGKLMSDLSHILSEIDALPPDELEAVYQHVSRKRPAKYWLVPGEHFRRIHEIMAPVHAEAASMTEEEINAAIDEAIEEVR